MDDIMKEYYDKSFISSLLCESTYNYYSYIYQMVIFPTILTSSILTVLNASEINKDIIQVINIVINGINTIILTINSYFKFNERASHFKNLRMKFNALNHKIESVINKKKNDNTFNINIDEIISDFDLLYNDIQYPFPTHIKTKVIHKYGKTRVLPNSLAIENSINASNVNIEII